MTYELRQVKVVGSGGRPRTVWHGCPFGCWHQSYSQAKKCVARFEAAQEKETKA